MCSPHMPTMKQVKSPDWGFVHSYCLPASPSSFASLHLCHLLLPPPASLHPSPRRPPPPGGCRPRTRTTSPSPAAAGTAPSTTARRPPARRRRVGTTAGRASWRTQRRRGARRGAPAWVSGPPPRHPRRPPTVEEALLRPALALAGAAAEPAVRRLDGHLRLPGAGARRHLRRRYQLRQVSRRRWSRGRRGHAGNQPISSPTFSGAKQQDTALFCLSTIQQRKTDTEVSREERPPKYMLQRCYFLVTSL